MAFLRDEVECQNRSPELVGWIPAKWKLLQEPW